MRRGRVMLVDDEPTIGAAVRRALAAHHDVVVFTDGHAALEAIAAGPSFDVILCDLMMPLMSGAEFHHALSCTSPDQAARIVFLSGGAFTEGSRAFVDRVPNLKIEKPFEVSELRAFVNDRVRNSLS